MRLRFKPFLIAALIALGAAAPPALSQSQDAGWFLGAGGGVSSAQDLCPGASTPGFTCDNRGTAWKVFAGYQFNSNFGYELAYTSLGKQTASLVGVTTATFETTAIDMVLVLTIPIDRFSLYGKWGLAIFDLERTIVGTGAGTTEAKGKEITYGFGLGYNLTKRMALQMEFQHYMDVGDVDTTGTSDINVGSFRIAFKF